MTTPPRRSALIPAILALAGVAAVVVAQNYTTIPPAADEVESQLKALDTDLIEAIKIAQDSVDGVAKAASADLSGPSPVYSVDVVAKGDHHRVVVDASSGAVTSTETVARFPGDPLEGAEMRTTDSGLMYYVLKKGDGPKPAGPTATVTVHYTGYFNDGSKFDSSYDRNQPATFPLNRVIAGWTEGVGDMRIGEKRKLIIPSDLGYGDRGRSGIPPKATLIFDVELISATPTASE